MADETPDTAAETEAAVDTETTEAVAEEAAVEAPPEPQLPPKEARRHARQRQTRSRRPASPEERTALRASKAAARRRRRQQEKAKRTPGEGTVAAPSVPGNPQERTGTVVSDKADKTITVRIEIVRRHRRYGKVIRSTSTMHAHDETNDANQGDLVRVVESRPLSATKRWRLVEVLERAK